MFLQVHIPDVEFVVNLGDWPVEAKSMKGKPFPIVSWCGSNETHDIIIPTYDLTTSTLGAMTKYVHVLYMCVDVRVHVCVHVYVDVYVDVCTCVCTCVYTCVCTFVCTCVCTCVCTFVCTFVCTCTSNCTYVLNIVIIIT